MEQLYQKTPEQLTEAQKQTVSALSQIASGLAGVAVGDSTASGIVSAEIGKRAVENNFFNMVFNPQHTDWTDIQNKIEGDIKLKQINDEVREELKK